MRLASFWNHYLLLPQPLFCSFLLKTKTANHKLPTMSSKSLPNEGFLRFESRSMWSFTVLHCPKIFYYELQGSPELVFLFFWFLLNVKLPYLGFWVLVFRFEHWAVLDARAGSPHRLTRGSIGCSIPWCRRLSSEAWKCQRSNPRSWRPSTEEEEDNSGSHWRWRKKSGWGWRKKKILLNYRHFYFLKYKGNNDISLNTPIWRRHISTVSHVSATIVPHWHFQRKI